MNYLLVVVLLKKLIAFAVSLSMVDTFHVARYAFGLRAHLEDYLLRECSMWGADKFLKGLWAFFLTVVGIEASTSCIQGKSSTTEPHHSPVQNLCSSPRQITEWYLWPIAIYLPVSVGDSPLGRTCKNHFYMCTKDRLKILLTFHRNTSYCIFIAFTDFYKGHVSWPVGGIFQTPSPIQSFSRDEVNSNVFTFVRIMLTPLPLIWTGWELGLVRGWCWVCI